jgi:hypothetical protein
MKGGGLELGSGLSSLNIPLIYSAPLLGRSSILPLQYNVRIHLLYPETT